MKIQSKKKIYVWGLVDLENNQYPSYFLLVIIEGLQSKPLVRMNIMDVISKLFCSSTPSQFCDVYFKFAILFITNKVCLSCTFDYYKYICWFYWFLVFLEIIYRVWNWLQHKNNVIVFKGLEFLFSWSLDLL